MTEAVEGRKAFSGVVERVVFHNPENGFAVLSVRVKGGHQPLTVVGRLPVVASGDRIQGDGRFRRDPKHGLQFQTDSLAVSPPDSLDGIRRYLGSGKVKGVGPKMAKRLVEAFGKGRLRRDREGTEAPRGGSGHRAETGPASECRLR